MIVHNGLLLKLSDIFNSNQPTQLDNNVDLQTIDQEKVMVELRQKYLKAKSEWCAGISALKHLLSNNQLVDLDNNSPYGLLLSTPSPIIKESGLVSLFHSGFFTSKAWENLALIPAEITSSPELKVPRNISELLELPLLPKDPIAGEQFCLVFTRKFSLIMVLGSDHNHFPIFHFSFDPEVIEKTWAILRWRLLVTNNQELPKLDNLIREFTPLTPDYRLVSEFSRQLLNYLPDLTSGLEQHTNPIKYLLAEKSQVPVKELINHCSVTEEKELELLQALTHEIRTPLTTIRTLTRLILKRSHLGKDISKPLETIDQECTEQINRMELIFKAAQLQTTPKKSIQLSSISLEHLFDQSIPRWQKQAQRRNVELEIIVPKKLPNVVSDPATLDQVLTGLMEKFTRSLPNGGRISVQVMTAGNQLKLELVSQCPYPLNPFKSLGQLLSFQPETGSLTLNMDVTKNLFNIIGGKLIVRQRPQQGEVLTIFLPFEVV